MAVSPQSRREIGFVIAIVLGLLLGFFIKRVKIGLLIGLVLGLLAAGMISGKKK
jgi:F0F1-type ATP synthase assembly protein I